MIVSAPAYSQSIFRDKRDTKPIIPTIVAPEGPDIPIDEEEPEFEVAAPDLEEDEVVATPVPLTKIQAEEALNRKRDAAANVSSPGVVALMRDAGQLTNLTPQTPLNINEPASNDGVDEGSEDSPSEDPLEDKLASTFETQLDARTFTFTIPAPRGQILDRFGNPLAQNKVVNYATIKFPRWGNDPDETAVLKYAADRINYVNRMLGTNWDLKPKVVREHYKNRRWMPLFFSAALAKWESDKLSKDKIEGLELKPVYLRHYPNEKTMAHIIGYVGKRPPRSINQISNDEPIWGAGIGVQGLEKSFNDILTGTPGKFTQLYDGDGKKIREDKISDPRPGNNIITTIDLPMQELAERLLREKSNRGAFVVMDCTNGDVRALASYPQFNPNDFIPSISSAKYKLLLDDKEKPLFPRAFQASYPPASTYKVATALAFLESGYITSGDTYPCPASWTVGNLTMKNWNSNAEGDMNVVSAIARSCNTWFYEIATYAGADAMSSISTRLGLGEKTGLPLPENSGFIPNNKYWIEKYHARLSDGDEANMSIGQGRVKTTPIQLARMMAAVGNQEHVYKARLVKQVQDYNHNVIDVYPPEVRNALGISSKSLYPVRQGMYNVVNADYGTGKAGYHGVTVAAKTGTGQWITAENRNIAWFAGYFPAKNPIYSFAMVYEGQPGEQVSGGKKAAPIVSAFLHEYLNSKRLAEVRSRSRALRGDYTPIENSWEQAKEIELTSAPKTDGGIFRGADGATSSSPAAAKKKPTASKPAAPPAAKPVDKPRRNTLFKRLFGKNRR